MPISFNKTNIEKETPQENNEEKKVKKIWIGEEYFSGLANNWDALEDREKVRLMNLRMKRELEDYIYNETISQFDDARTNTLYSILDNYY